MIHDFTITDLTPRPGYPSYWNSLYNCEVYCVGYRTVDARGHQVPMVQWCDDETGEVRRVDYDPVTKQYGIDPATGRVRVVHERRPAPLVVTMLRPDEPYLLNPHVCL